MELNQPYYIEPRKDDTHVDLGGSWDFCWVDTQTDEISQLEYEHSATLPQSVYWCLYEAGVLPHPYDALNSRQYHWVDEKVWYFKKTFTVDENASGKTAFLCFDGIAYYSRVWFNGELLGDHEGMFGGPVCDVSEYLVIGENTIIVEVKACNFGKKDTFDYLNSKGENREIVPWNIARDKSSSGGDFIVMGIWNRIRLELLEPIHLSRPYVFTESIGEDSATLDFEVQIANGEVNELKPFMEHALGCYSYTCAYDNGLTGIKRDEKVDIGITLTEPDTKKTVYSSVDTEGLLDYKKMGVQERFFELQFFRKKIEIKNPKLWEPYGVGVPYLYDMKLTLSMNGKLLDTHELKVGIRTFTADYTAGDKYRARWEKFLFSINGRQIFIKGINWFPLDYLYAIKPAEYRWVLEAVKNAGVQFIRVWSGGGMPETDTFYDICDELGIMVWQDHMIANTANTQSYPQEVLECQEAYNVYRMRNHPSLVMHCGGNEFNPYSYNNAANMFIISRTLKDLDPSRIFHYTTRDKGSAHIYRDMEPVWYRHIYKHLPFVAESGIHSFPNYKSLAQLIDKSEREGVLPDLTTPAFYEKYKDLLNHFSEYQPDRVPRMLSRISQIGNIKTFDLKAMCEAAQIQAYEYYQLMIGALRENYPYCGGIIPWVLKRPWTTVAIQMMDGMGLPTYQYYAMQNAYRMLSVCFLEQWSILAPLESVPLKVRVFNDTDESACGKQIKLTVYKPDLSLAASYTATVDDQDRVYDFGEFKLDDGYTNTCFIISVDLTDNGKLLHRDTHFLKCTDMLADEELFNKYRSKPSDNLTFDNGPWLIDSIKAANKATLNAECVELPADYGYRKFEITLENVSDYPAYPVTLDVKNTECRFFADDNFFMLLGGERKVVTLTCDGLGSDEVPQIEIALLNGENIQIG